MRRLGSEDDRGLPNPCARPIIPKETVLLAATVDEIPWLMFAPKKPMRPPAPRRTDSRMDGALAEDSSKRPLADRLTSEVDVRRGDSRVDVDSEVAAVVAEVAVVDDDDDGESAVDNEVDATGDSAVGAARSAWVGPAKPDVVAGGGAPAAERVRRPPPSSAAIGSGSVLRNSCWRLRWKILRRSGSSKDAGDVATSCSAVAMVSKTRQRRRKSSVSAASTIGVNDCDDKDEEDDEDDDDDEEADDESCGGPSSDVRDADRVRGRRVPEAAGGEVAAVDEAVVLDVANEVETSLARARVRRMHAKRTPPTVRVVSRRSAHAWATATPSGRSGTQSSAIERSSTALGGGTRNISAPRATQRGTPTPSDPTVAGTASQSRRWKMTGFEGQSWAA